jgi:hypothetical protein
LFAAQEQAINTNAKRRGVYKEKEENGDRVSGLCRVCGDKQETVAHVVGGCGVLMQGPGTIRHNRVGARVHWELCRKYGVPCSERWYEHRPQEISVNTAGTVRLLWDSSHYTAESVRHNKPDVVVVDFKEKMVTIIDFAVPLDHNVVKKELEKVEKYHPLAQYYRIKYKTFQTRIIPVVVGAFGIIPANLPNNLAKLGIPDVVGGLQLTALLGTRRILKNTLSLR